MSLKMHRAVEKFPALSIGNYEATQLQDSGCYFCLRICSGEEVVDTKDNGSTALCPHCGIDSLLPGVLTIHTLKMGLKRWFTGRQR